MKAVIKNIETFTKYSNEQDRTHCVGTLCEKYSKNSEQEEYQVPSVDNENRVYVFEPLFEIGNEVVFRFIEAIKG